MFFVTKDHQVDAAFEASYFRPTSTNSDEEDSSPAIDTAAAELICKRRLLQTAVDRGRTMTDCHGMRSWTSEETSMLIEMWGNLPCLWNPKHPNYFKKEQRKSETNMIAETFNCTANDVTKKLSNLRTYYNKEASKARMTGNGTDGIYISKWPYFNQLDSILRDCFPRKTSAGWDLEQDRSVSDSDAGVNESNFERTCDGSPSDLGQNHSVAPLCLVENASCAMLPSTSTSRSSCRSHIKRFQKRSLPTEYNFIMEATAALSAAKQRCMSVPPEDEFDIYGRHIANELRAIKDEASRDYIKYKFGQILYEVKLGNIDS